MKNDETAQTVGFFNKPRLTIGFLNGPRLTDGFDQK